MGNFHLLGTEFHFARRNSSVDGWVVTAIQQCECTHATELYILKIKQKTGSAGEDMEKSLHTLGGDTKWCSCYG